MHTILAFLRGIFEFRTDLTWVDPGRDDVNHYTQLDQAYDRGRDFAHLITLRKFDR